MADTSFLFYFMLLPTSSATKPNASLCFMNSKPLAPPCLEPDPDPDRVPAGRLSNTLGACAAGAEGWKDEAGRKADGAGLNAPRPVPTGATPYGEGFICGAGAKALMPILGLVMGAGPPNEASKGVCCGSMGAGALTGAGAAGTAGRGAGAEEAKPARGSKTVCTGGSSHMRLSPLR